LDNYALAARCHRRRQGEFRIQEVKESEFRIADCGNSALRTLFQGIQESEFPLTLGAALNLEGPILKTAFLSGLSA
jgi:hypothetical protein